VSNLGQHSGRSGQDSCRSKNIVSNRIKEGGTNSGGQPAGTIVYDLRGYDYGLASDDSRATGIEHVSVTLNADGDYPSFTIRKSFLEQLQ
jgi:hypothetical protein